MSSKERFFWRRFTTPAYKKEALRLVIEEANRVARELKLAETLPITETNLVEAFIGLPRFSLFVAGIGNVTTSNYNYCVTVGNKFSYLVRTHLEQEYGQLKERYRWPLSRIDTNAAYQLATQWLTAVAMDVKGLNRDCRLSIRPWIPEGGKYFVPVYWICWSKKAKPLPPHVEIAAEHEWVPVASVEMLLPTKSLRQMHVEESEYILRKPVTITNVDYLLSQTNTPLNRAPR
jgi:hypothetical protein